MIDTNSCHERETYDLPDKMTAFQELKFHDIEMHAECLFACHPERRSPYL